jgi:VIT1/CCC1 family predicted Fe2+/Mn2+ transporter
MAGPVISPIRSGISFGLTSGVITTLGLMVGLHAGTHSTLAVGGGILTIAVADALSDALGMHISEESHATRSAGAIWRSTIATFVAKLLTALSFLIPVLLFELSTAIIVSIAWGLAVLTALSYRLARRQAVPPWKVIGEHLMIAGLVIALTHLLGDWVAATFR